MCMTFVCDAHACVHMHLGSYWKDLLVWLSAGYYSLQLIREETEYAKAPEKSREQCHTLANVHMAQCPTQGGSFSGTCDDTAGKD